MSGSGNPAALAAPWPNASTKSALTCEFRTFPSTHTETHGHERPAGYACRTVRLVTALRTSPTQLIS
jgi:hypothetical protein